MPEVEFFRQIISISMLFVASCSDIKKREVSDLVWLVFGGASLMLYLFEPANLVMVLYLALGITIGVAGMLGRFFGQADCFALFALAVTLPALDMLPVTTLVACISIVLASVYCLCSNIFYNISDLSRGRLFSEIHERPYRKLLAFFVLHRKRDAERFVFKAQEGDKFVFNLRPKSELELADNFQGCVASAVPLIPFMLVSLVLMLFLLP